VANPTLDWNAALADCQAWGGTLAALTSAEENTFASALVANNTWIGGSDAAAPNAWVWASGEPWVYESWEAGEPNDSGDCVHIWHANSAGWDDTDCASSRAYLCERAGP
jgi:hypothetical protein